MVFDDFDTKSVFMFNMSFYMVTFNVDATSQFMLQRDDDMVISLLQMIHLIQVSNLPTCLNDV